MMLAMCYHDRSLLTHVYIILRAFVEVFMVLCHRDSTRCSYMFMSV